MLVKKGFDDFKNMMISDAQEIDVCQPFVFTQQSKTDFSFQYSIPIKEAYYEFK
ncbi:hypothetical protein [Lysinibacillus parviboronicapiens]|uniref:hypothetical protein n=1 Tax=Lysinibacillus parviboronicapiens TaxID=436516 RepID=UPI00187D1C37|nr:hypothetical protein [Lysinibacillus parviboronicapiens]